MESQSSRFPQILAIIRITPVTSINSIVSMICLLETENQWTEKMKIKNVLGPRSPGGQSLKAEILI